MGFSNHRAERTDSRSRHREIVIDVRLPVGSGIGGPHVNVMVADDAAVGHRLRKRLGRVTESCVRPVVLLDQIPLAMEFVVDPCVSFGFIRRLPSIYYGDSYYYYSVLPIFKCLCLCSAYVG